MTNKILTPWSKVGTLETEDLVAKEVLLTGLVLLIL